MARDNLTILEARYKNGDALVIEFLDAQIELVNAERQIADVTRSCSWRGIELRGVAGQVVGVRPWLDAQEASAPCGRGSGRRRGARRRVGVCVRQARRRRAKELDQSLIVDGQARRPRHRGDRDRQGPAAREGRDQVQGRGPGRARCSSTRASTVKKGQLLLRLDPTDYAREVARADARAWRRRRTRSSSPSSTSTAQAAGARGARRGAGRRRPGAERGAGARRWRCSTRRGRALSAARTGCATPRSPRRIDGTVIERGIEPGEVVTPGRAGDLRGQAAAHGGRSRRR